MSKNRLLRIAAGLLVLAYLSATLFFPSNRITIRNAASQNVRSIDIGVWNDLIHARNLLPGEELTTTFGSGNFDDGFHVTAVLSDGRVLEKTDGYVTTGSFRSEYCTVTVYEDTIDVRQRPPTGVRPAL